MKIFLSGGTIYSFDDSQRSISKGCLGIDDEQILFISAEKPKDFTADRIVNCKECLILPGFVNCHTHLAENLFKGLMDEVDFEGLFYSTLFRWESQLDPEMIYWGSLIGALDALRCGVTTVADMYHYASSTAKAVSEAGLRAYIGQKVLGFSLNSPPYQTGHGVNYNFNFLDFSKQLESAVTFALKWRGVSNGLITTSIAPHATNTLNREMFTEVADQARENGLGVHLHLAQMASEKEEIKVREGMECVEFLEDVGLLQGPVLGAHAIFLKEKEIERIYQNKVSISHNPVVNAKDAALVAPVSEMREKGVKVGLGTDAFQMNMLETARFATLINRIKTGKPDYLPAYEALAMATIDGAKALGMDEKIGSLEEGKKADIVVFDLSRLNTQPIVDPIKDLLYYGDASNIKLVIVNGEIVFEGGKFTNVDELHVRKEFLRMIKRLKSKLG